MIPPLLHVCSGLARPADESMLARDIGTMEQTAEHSKKYSHSLHCAQPADCGLLRHIHKKVGRAH